MSEREREKERDAHSHTNREAHTRKYAHAAGKRVDSAITRRQRRELVVLERELLEVDEVGKHVWRQARQLVFSQVQIPQSHHALEAFRGQKGELVLVEGEALQLQACGGGVSVNPVRCLVT